MFRIYNKYELERLRTVLLFLEEGTLNYPLDIFRDATAIAVLEYGVDDKMRYSYTHDEITVKESRTGTSGYRRSWKSREQKFENSIQETRINGSVVD